MSGDVIERLEEHGRRHARNVTYSSGKWSQLVSLIPKFELADFKVAESEPANPYLKAVVRLPIKTFERRIPVGIVSNSYPMAQHTDVAEQCLIGVSGLGLDPAKLKCELGLTELGEWMNLRIYFPAEFNHKHQNGDDLTLRLECFNSVDGSSRLVLFLGWFRFVCSNGLVIGETMAELRDVHDEHLDLRPIPEMIQGAMNILRTDIERLDSWRSSLFNNQEFEAWINNDVSTAYNKKAACRVFHICRSGQDVEMANPSATGPASERAVEHTIQVPGSPSNAKTLFDVSQALSWVATNRTNVPERLAWQAKIPQLLLKLPVTSS